MADTDLPSTGKDTKITIAVDGVLVQVQDQVTNFKNKLMVDEITTKVMGRSGSQIDQESTGWEGSFDVATGTAEVDEMFDLIDAARRTRVPVVINIVDTTNYRDLTSKTYTYPDCKLTYDRSASRGEATKITVGWKTGGARIAS